MNEKQIKAIKCLNELEQYAKEQKLSTRIIDSISECQKRITENSNWNEVDMTVENLFKSIENKLGLTSVQTDNNKNEVSVQQIKAQITKMAERCHTENETSIEMMAEQKNVIIKKAYEDMQEISHTKAHLDELKNEDLYLEFFQKTKRDYEKNVFHVIREMLSDISSNYNHMLEHMRSMFQSIGGFTGGIGNEKFYYEFEGKKDGIEKKINSEAESSEVGGSDIVSFGQRTKDTIKDIVKKLNRKRRLLIWVPFFVLVILFSVKAVTSQEQNYQTIENAETGSEDDSEVKGFMVDAGKQIGEKVIQSVSLKALGSFISAIFTFLIALVISLGAVLIFLILLVIVIYAAYIKIINRWCNHQICKKSGEYLKTELIQFEQSNVLMPKLEEVMKNSAEEYERQYLAVLNQIFSGTNYDFNSVEKKELNQFTVLREEWNTLRYE